MKVLQIQERQHPYTGARLHRVAQITAQVSGLVLCLVVADDLGQVLGNQMGETITKRTTGSNPVE